LVKGDICDSKLINKLFERYNFVGVIHFAAESHVDNSIKNPDAFINTNVYGTFNLLNMAKNHSMDASFSYKEGFENNRFHHISTEEVYGTLGEKGLFTEATPYAPNSPYSALKA
jgi:dTDP-glucose 4,6-dehydratase